MTLAQRPLARTRSLLGHQILGLLSGRNSRRILICSANSGAGASTCTNLIATELNAISKHPVRKLTIDELHQTAPDSFGDQAMVLVEGPALTSVNGVERIPQEWLKYLQASVIVVAARSTRHPELKDAISQLQQLDIPPLGFIWNEYPLLKPSELLTMFQARVMSVVERFRK